jgi:glutathione S-transferase
MLAEKGLPARLIATEPWRPDEDFQRRNPAGTIPVLIDEPPTGGEISVSPALAICDYLEEAYGSSPLLPTISAGRAEARRLAHWFEGKFEVEVNARIFRLRIDERAQGKYRYDSEVWRAGTEALAWHLDYLSFLLETRGWLAGDRMTFADLVGAAHLSSSDYLGVVPWAAFPAVKEWYQRIKSRPSFRPLLADRIDGVPPPSHYDDLDF